MEENTVLTFNEIKKRAISSFMSLSARQIALRALSFISINIILAKILPVETLGIYNIAASIITFFAFFSDVGLAASLIQKSDEILESDIRTVFTIQQLLVGAFSILIIFGAGIFVPLLFKLDLDGIWLVRILGISFFLSSLKVIPSIVLERNLRFKPLVLVEMVETIVFNLTLIILAFFNFNIWAFSAAAILRGVVGVGLIYTIQPVKLGFGINKQSARQLFRFGLPFQINSLLAMLKDRLVPLVIAGMIGPVGMGWVTWAQAMAFLPLEAMNIIIRITFPAFSRLQHNRIILSQSVEKVLFIATSLVYPMLFGLIALMPAIINHVVSSKWSSALPSFYLFCASSFWAVISTTLTNTLNAMGNIKATLKLMIFWTVITWVLTPVLVWAYGFLGVALSSFVISFTSVLTIIVAKRSLQIQVIKSVALPVAASITMAVVVSIYSYVFIQNLLTLVLGIILGAFIYLGIFVIFAKDRLIANVRLLKNV